MRCSSCETLLDQFVEGTLSAPRMTAVSQHLDHCNSCQTILHELKVIDGLLVTTQQPELPFNFTFAVMAEVNTIPAPRTKHLPVWSFTALYLVAAWVALFFGLVFVGVAPSRLASAISSNVFHFFGQIGAVGSAIAHSFGAQTPAFAAFGFGLLFIDVAVAGTAAVIYFLIRPRLAAHLAASEEA